jgi:hypothetical protein
MIADFLSVARWNRWAGAVLGSGRFSIAQQFEWCADTVRMLGDRALDLNWTRKE